jgi:hypothetical protein
VNVRVYVGLAADCEGLAVDEVGKVNVLDDGDETFQESTRRKSPSFLS